MKKKNTPGIIANRRARYDYELGDELVAGVVLTGKETKALRMGHGHLRGAYVTLQGNELVLINATITSTNAFIIPEQDQTRSRKLLASKKQIASLIESKHSGKTIVPLAFITNGKFIKLRIAIGRGKKRYDKRETIKQRDQLRDIERNL